MKHLYKDGLLKSILNFRKLAQKIDVWTQDENSISNIYSLLTRIYFLLAHNED